MVGGFPRGGEGLVPREPPPPLASERGRCCCMAGKLLPPAPGDDRYVREAVEKALAPVLKRLGQLEPEAPFFSRRLRGYVMDAPQEMQP